MNIETNLKKVKDFLSTKKFTYFKILDIENISSLGSYFIIISFDNIKSVESVADDLLFFLESNSINVSHRDGIKTGWIVFDLMDIIIHIFNEDDRVYYNLEKNWADAEIVEI